MTPDALQSPLLSLRLLQTPPLGGRIKERPEDFLVDEIPLIEPTGQGEHLHLGVQKRGLSHDDMVRAIARHCGVSERAVGHAGMKDKAAVTRQTVSVHLPGLPDPPVLERDELQVLWARRSDAKLRPGQLRGNRFAVRIRQVDPLHAPRVLQGLRTLSIRGAPNAYGAQRFGHRCNGHRLGLLLAGERWDELIQELCGTKGSAFPEWQLPARERFDAGDFEASLPLWSRGDHAERAVVASLAQGRDARRAVRAIRQSNRIFWMNALQSAAFNAVLGARMRRGLLDQFVAGDVANLHPGRSLFRVHAAMVSDPVQAAELAQRAQRFECSPTGPMPGPDAMEPEGEALELERAAILEAGLDVQALLSAKDAPAGERRSLRMRVGDPQVESGVDEHGPYVRVAFDLPRGGFATAVLAEIMGRGTDHALEATGEPASGDRGR